MSVIPGIELGDAPYPGLRPFHRHERAIFFGRDEQVDQLLEKLETNRFLAIVGASGCGKSSLVRAGMLSALEGGYMLKAGPRWRIVEIRPGDRPFLRYAAALLAAGLFDERWNSRPHPEAFLASTLRRGPFGLVEALRESPLPEGHNLLVLVDQFEEIFRYHRYGDSREALAFVNLLLATAESEELSAYVVLTMRSDFLGDCALFEGLPEAINRGQFLTPRLTRDQCREAIVGPAAVFGGEVEEELVTVILNDMGTDQDQLPLMQHALRRMWTVSRGVAAHPATPAVTEPDAPGAGVWPAEPAFVLTRDAYDRCGGLRKALSEHATEAYRHDLDPEQERIAEVLFRCLTERGEGRRDTRRPARLGEVAEVAGVDPQDVAVVVEVFRREDRCFLTPAAGTPLGPDTTLDISHESLIRQWDLLAGWVDEEARSAAMYARLAETAELWTCGEAKEWGTPDLDNALKWKQEQRPTEAWALRYGTRGGEEHVGAGPASSPEEIARQYNEQARARYRTAMRFLDASVKARETAIREKEEQRRRELELLQNKAQAEAKSARLEKERREDAEQRRAEAVLYAAKLRRRAFISYGFGIASLLLAGTALYLYFAASSARRDAEDARDRSAQAAYNVQLSRAGDLWSSSPDLTRSLLYDTERCPVEHRSFTWGLHNRLSLLQTNSDRRTLDRTSLNTPVFTAGSSSALPAQAVPIGRALAACFTPDGQSVVAGFDDGMIVYWNVETGNPIRSLKGHEGAVNALSLSNSGEKTILVSGGSDQAVKFWDLGTGAPSVRPVLLPFPVERLATLNFGIGSGLFASGRGQTKTLRPDGTGELGYNAKLMNEVKKARYVDFVIPSFLGPFSDVYLLMTDDTTLKGFEGRMTSAKGPTKIQFGTPNQRHRATITALEVAPERGLVATASRDGSVFLWSLKDRTLARSLDHPARGHVGLLLA